jgi:MSHA type pilus biogenesis protein MshL
MKMSKNTSYKRAETFKLSAVMMSIIFVAGCGSSPPLTAHKNLPDPSPQELARIQEVIAAESKRLREQQEQLIEQIKQASAQTKPAIPVAPKAPVFDPLEGKNVSIAISSATISQVLAIFADVAKINLIVEPAVVQKGALSDMYMRDVSLRDAFAEVLKSYDVAGDITGQTLRIRANEEKFFALNFLNVSSQLSMTSGGNVFGANSSAGAASAISGNLSMTTNTANRADPYAEFESSLRMILGENKPPSESQNQTIAARSTLPQTQSPTAVIQPNQNQTFTLNRTTGMLYVKARPSQMRAVEDLIKMSQGMLTKQVRIEAQLIDVQLNDGYQFGVDWSVLRNKVAVNFGANPGTLSGITNGSLVGGNPPASITIPARLLGAAAGQTSGAIAFADQNSTAVISALRSFGTLKILSNPSIQTRNGTPAMLSVGTSQRYVSRSSSAQTNPGGGATTTTSDVQTDSVFSGVMVGVLPLLREDGRVELLINPVQSEVDPQSLQLVAVNDSNRVSLPQVAYKSFSTTLNVADGDVVVVGGLIDQKTSNTNRGLPGLSDVPLFGKLASQEGTSAATRELIVVLRVRVL